MFKGVFILILGFSLCSGLGAQVCEGNLGENIFEDGDFGTGVANVLLPDPQIAPGYNYQSNPPPDDGFYTITNNTSVWGSFASTWDNIRDNSSDPNGYMMVVNASFGPGIFYEKEVTGLCENTLYVFSADVYNLIDALNPNISFQLDGVTFFESGEVPYNRQWNTYGFTFATGAGQTSLTLSITNNAPGGLGNDLALDNITFRPCGPEALILPRDIANICEDGDPIELEATIVGDQYDTPQFQWQQSFDEGNTWVDLAGENGPSFTHTDLRGGFYYYRYLLANDPDNLLNTKCRVNSNVKIVNVVPKFYTIIDTLCEGLSFSLGQNLYNQTGIYVDSLITTLGCDSIVTLDLTIVPDSELELLFDLMDPRCSYSTDGVISVIEVVNSFPPLEVFADGVINNEFADLNGRGAGEYNYLITDRFGCQLDTTVQLIAPPAFIIDIGPDFEVDLGEEIQVNPIFSETVQTIQWDDGPIVDCLGACDGISFLPTDSALLELTATTPLGCIAKDSLNVVVNKVRKVYIPNVFNPQDINNKSFTVFGDTPNVQIVEQLEVYDRWGTLIFEASNILPNDTEVGWNGRGKDFPIEKGIYTYWARVRFLDEAVLFYSGDVMLLK